MFGQLANSMYTSLYRQTDMDHMSMLPVATSINSSTYLISEANHIINDFNSVSYNPSCYQTEGLPHYETITNDNSLVAPKLNIIQANSTKSTFEDLNTPAASSKTSQPKFFGPTIAEPPLITGWFFTLCFFLLFSESLKMGHFCGYLDSVNCFNRWMVTGLLFLYVWHLVCIEHYSQ